MDTQLLRIAVITQLWTSDVVDRVGQARRRLAEEDGQTAAEYLGIVLLVAVIIAAVVGSGIAGDIADRITELVEKIGKGEDPN